MIGKLFTVAAVALIAAAAVRTALRTQEPQAPAEAPQETEESPWADDQPEEAEETTRPSTDAIEAAASVYRSAAQAARTADKAKREARKTLDTLPAGIDGTWRLVWKASSREVVDTAAVRELFRPHGLGAVPMKAVAPSLVVESC